MTYHKDECVYAHQSRLQTQQISMNSKCVFEECHGLINGLRKRSCLVELDSASKSVNGVPQGIPRHILCSFPAGCIEI
jgi:hypothetical protein